jgi:SAM-dependent methyltransferase
MSLNLSQERWEEIRKFQELELMQLASDPKFARQSAAMDHFSRISAWIEPELGRRVLEVGCGPGRYVAMLASLGFDVVGVDPNTYPTWQTIKSLQQVEFLEGVFAEALPFPDSSFDHVACIAALLYFNDPIRSLAEIRRVLRPGGRMVLRSVSRWTPYRLLSGKPLDPASRNHYNMAEFVKLAHDAGFEVHQSFSYGFYPPIFVSRWWHLLNGPISTKAQSTISTLTPPPFRHQLVIFCATPSALKAPKGYLEDDVHGERVLSPAGPTRT